MLASSPSPTQNLKGTWKNKHTVRKDYRIEFLVLWSNLSPVHAKSFGYKSQQSGRRMLLPMFRSQRAEEACKIPDNCKDFK